MECTRHGRPECKCNEPDPRNCEPCSYFGEHVPATQSRGMDYAPVCDWHAHGSWSAKAKCAKLVPRTIVIDNACSSPLPCPHHDKECDHPLGFRGWMWDGAFNCFKCGAHVQPNEETDV